MCNTVELSTTYCEYGSVAIELSEGNSVLITSVYRSPNSSVDNNARLL